MGYLAAPFLGNLRTVSLIVDFALRRSSRDLDMPLSMLTAAVRAVCNLSAEVRFTLKTELVDQTADLESLAHLVEPVHIRRSVDLDLIEHHTTFRGSFHNRKAGSSQSANQRLAPAISH